ncbi:hypothetical protein VP01_4654g1, partial [Puccinia sorghi]
MFSLPTNTFGIQSGPEVPPGCSINQIHLLHRHGARYPTEGTLLPQFGKFIYQAQNSSSQWGFVILEHLEAQNIKKLILFSSVRIITIQLGSEILTPFGRSQMFQLGTSYRQ